MSADMGPGFAMYMESIGATIHEVLFVIEKEDYPVLPDDAPVSFTIVGTREQIEAVRAGTLGDPSITEDAIEVEDEEPIPAASGPVLETPEDMDAFIEANLAGV
jgi:hypothetical protein